MTANPYSGGAQRLGAGSQNPWFVLGVLCMAIFMLLLDTTIVNVAQVKIKDDLGATLTQIQWILDAYILAYAVLLLSFGRLGDVFGRKKLFLVGMAVFTAASVLCAASAWLGDQLGISGANVLIFARVLQGIGGAFMMPQTLSLLMVTFPAEKRGTALGIWGSVVALGAIVGPVLGGFIVTNYAWEWIFLINLPVGMLLIYLTLKVIPESTDPMASGKVDWGGLVFSGTGIFALVFACIEGNRLGWTSPAILLSFAASAFLLTVFILWERRVPDPMIKLELFKIRNFTVSNIIATIVAFGMLGIFFPMTLFLQQALGYSPIKAGLSMTPMSIMILIAAPFAGRFTDRFGPRWILVAGTGLMTIGILLIVQSISLETTPLSLAPSMAITGLGMGMTFSPMTAAAMRDVPHRIAGSASGILNTMRNIGQVLGIAILGSFLQNRIGFFTTDRLGESELEPQVADQIAEMASQNQFTELMTLVPDSLSGFVQDQVDAAFVSAIHSTFTAGAVACAVAVVGALMLRNPDRAKVTVGSSTTDVREASIAD
ncbi:DHA2 family efflux MFS transporter permease subunit [soil metagenome]